MLMDAIRGKLSLVAAVRDGSALLPSAVVQAVLMCPLSKCN